MGAGGAVGAESKRNPKTHRPAARRGDKGTSTANSHRGCLPGPRGQWLSPSSWDPPIHMAMGWPRRPYLNDLTLPSWLLLVGAGVDNCPQMTGRTLLLPAPPRPHRRLPLLGRKRVCRGEDSPQCPPREPPCQPSTARNLSGVRESSRLSKLLVSVFATPSISCLKGACTVPHV